MPIDKAISQHTERLPVPLTQDEFHRCATRVAQLHGDLTSHNAQSKSASATAAARKKEIEAQITQLAEQMRNGAETRDVTIAVVLDANEALEIRTDTEEVLRRRPIRPDEQQHKLFGDDVQPDKEDETAP